MQYVECIWKFTGEWYVFDRYQLLVKALKNECNNNISMEIEKSKFRYSFFWFSGNPEMSFSFFMPVGFADTLRQIQNLEMLKLLKRQLRMLLHAPGMHTCIWCDCSSKTDKTVILFPGKKTIQNVCDTSLRIYQKFFRNKSRLSLSDSKVKLGAKKFCNKWKIGLNYWRNQPSYLISD